MRLNLIRCKDWVVTDLYIPLDLPGSLKVDNMKLTGTSRLCEMISSAIAFAASISSFMLPVESMTNTRVT